MFERCWNYLEVVGRGSLEFAATVTDNDVEPGYLSLNALIPRPANLRQQEEGIWMREFWGSEAVDDCWHLSQSLPGTEVVSWEMITPFTPPLRWIAKASRQYPDLQFTIGWHSGEAHPHSGRASFRAGIRDETTAWTLAGFDIANICCAWEGCALPAAVSSHPMDLLSAPDPRTLLESYCENHVLPAAVVAAAKE